jgi:hypothetical protein
MQLFGSAILGLAVGTLYIFLSGMIGMSIGSLIIGAALLAAIAFLTLAVLTTIRRRAPLWPFTVATAVPLLVVGAFGGPNVASITFFTFGGAALLGGLAGRYLSAALSNQRLERPAMHKDDAP